MLQFICPRVDHYSQRVFIPGGSGVIVARLDGGRLVREKTLTCVKYPKSVDAMSPDTVCICGVGSGSVSIVDVRDDRIISTLNNPEGVTCEQPNSVAVLGDSIIVKYDIGPLVVYRHGSPDPVRVPLRPEWGYLISISTDRQHHFLITDSRTKNVLVVDVSGEVLHKVEIKAHSSIVDCAVVKRQLWVGCRNSDIVVMSPQYVDY